MNYIDIKWIWNITTQNCLSSSLIFNRIKFLVRQHNSHNLLKSTQHRFNNEILWNGMQKLQLATWCAVTDAPTTDANLIKHNLFDFWTHWINWIDQKENLEVFLFFKFPRMPIDQAYWTLLSSIISFVIVSSIIICHHLNLDNWLRINWVSSSSSKCDRSYTTI